MRATTEEKKLLKELDKLGKYCIKLESKLLKQTKNKKMILASSQMLHALLRIREQINTENEFNKLRMLGKNWQEELELIDLTIFDATN